MFRPPLTGLCLSPDVPDAPDASIEFPTALTTAPPGPFAGPGALALAPPGILTELLSPPPGGAGTPESPVVPFPLALASEPLGPVTAVPVLPRETPATRWIPDATPEIMEVDGAGED